MDQKQQAQNEQGPRLLSTTAAARALAISERHLRALSLPHTPRARPRELLSAFVSARLTPQSQRAQNAALMESGKTPGESGDLAVEASGKVADHIEVKVSAKGFYAGVLLAGGGFALEMLKLDVMHNPQHLVLCLITVAVCGFMGGTAVMMSRLNDAHRQIELRREEIERMAGERRVLEGKLLQKRLSSGKGKG